jgi:uncharacterized protein involved in exopolysaccharide biosynthesis
MKAAPTASNSKSRAVRKSALNVFDFLFVLFKHKWKIIFFLFLGLAAASALIYKNLSSPIFESRAKLLVRYVLERSAVDPYEAKADASGARGVAVMDAEIEIIKSSDLLLEVAKQIGPKMIVTNPRVQPSEAEAAIAISKHLEVTAARGSNVIHLSYQHRDPVVAVTVLKQLIDTYFEKHLEIHRSTGAFESVARQTDKARSQLSQTESELSKLSAESGFLSLADAKAALEARRNEIRSNLMASQVELAEQKVVVASLARAIGTPPDDPAKKALEEEADSATPDSMDQLKARQMYQDLAEQLSTFKQRRNTLMMSRKKGDPMLNSLDRQIAEIQQQGLELVAEYPSLARQSPMPGVSSSVTPGADLNVERAKLDSLEARVKMLESYLASVDAEVEKLSAGSMVINNLERRRQLEEETYRYYEVSLEKARVDEALNPASMPNIGVVQSPSAPTKPFLAKTLQSAAALLAAGLAVGLGFAFLSEWVINRRVSRPFEIQTRLQLPLMMAIPWIRSKDCVNRLLRGDSATGTGTFGGDLILHPESPGAGIRMATDDSDHFIMPFARAIRDRIMFGFEVGNINHKPKLIGLTGLSPGAGTSTLAIATARAFAENGRFHVLLVDLNSSWSGSLPVSSVAPLKNALEYSQSRSFDRHSGGLDYARAPTQVCGKGGRSLESIAMHELMPQMGVSQYDYIVFDMPKVSKTSPTVALAGYMDKVLLVLDAENTDRESLSACYSELEKCAPDVSCIFNRTRTIAPRWVAGEM